MSASPALRLFHGLLGARSPALLEVEPASATINEGSTQQLIATVYDQNGNALPNAVVEWESDDTAIATVDSSGLVTAVAAGSATITATSGPLSDTCTVTVLGVDPFWDDVVLLIDDTQPGNF